MKVLLLTYYYPPDRAVGATRAANVVRALEDRGHQVSVVAAGSSASTAGQVHRIQPNRNMAELYRAARRRHRPEKRAEGNASAAAKEEQGLPWWKQVLLSLLLVPDESQGYVGPAVKLGRRIAAGQPHVLLSTAPPHSVTLAALLVRMSTGLPWIAEFRDPWTDNAIRPPYHTRMRAGIGRLLERMSLRYADRVVPVTDAAARLLRDRVADPEKIVVVRNGVPSSPPPPEPPVGDTFRVVHTGTLYGSRDPRPLIAAIAAVRARGTIPLPQSIQLELVGNCSWYEPLVLEAAKQLAPPDRVVLYGEVSRSESAARMRGADLLLLLAQDQPLQVPQKLYDYLAGGRPILALVDPEGESAAMLRQLGGHLPVCSGAVEDIVSALETAIRNRATPLQTDERLLEEWSVAEQMKRLVEVVEETGGRRPQ